MPALPNGNASAVVDFDGRVGGGEGGPVRPHLVRQRRQREPEQQPARRSRPAGGSRQFAAELLGKLPPPDQPGWHWPGVQQRPQTATRWRLLQPAQRQPGGIGGDRDHRAGGGGSGNHPGRRGGRQSGVGGLGLGPSPTGLPGSKFTLPTLAAVRSRLTRPNPRRTRTGPKREMTTDRIDHAGAIVVWHRRLRRPAAERAAARLPVGRIHSRHEHPDPHLAVSPGPRHSAGLSRW